VNVKRRVGECPEPESRLIGVTGAGLNLKIPKRGFYLTIGI
jgi:hypothetical protein